VSDYTNYRSLGGESNLVCRADRGKSSRSVLTGALFNLLERRDLTASADTNLPARLEWQNRVSPQPSGFAVFSAWEALSAWMPSVSFHCFWPVNCVSDLRCPACAGHQTRVHAVRGSRDLENSLFTRSVHAETSGERGGVSGTFSQSPETIVPRGQINIRFG
jgi:hypothetical protein